MYYYPGFLEKLLSAREDYDMIKRDQEKAMYGDWDKTEADFQLQQAKV